MKSIFVRQVILTIIAGEQKINAITTRFPSDSSGWFPQILHDQQDSISAPIFVRGGSQSDREDNEVKEYDSDAVEKVEINEDSFHNQGHHERSAQREYHDMEDIEIIPFDSEDESITSVDYVPVDNDGDEIVLENVEIIPFDSYDDEYNTDETILVPFDETAEDSDPNFDRESAKSLDDVGHDKNESRVEIELEEIQNHHVLGPEDKEDNKTTLISSDSTTESFRRFLCLRDRILSLLSVWRDMDRESMEDGEQDSHSIRGLLHSRAVEYVEELTAFQGECKFSLAHNRSIPTIEKMAPRPKTFLHYITPKIQAVKLSPEIMLRIRNAQPNDVGDAIRAIGILGCLVDLYNIVLVELTPLAENRHYDQSESVRKEIYKDRRFGQLLECASCGIDIKRRLETFTELKRDDDYDQDLEGKCLYDTEDGEEQQPECIEVSECSRWIMGMVALKVDGAMTIRTQNTTGVVLSLAMRSSDLLQASFKKAGTALERISLLRDIVDTIRVLSCAADEWNIKVYSILEMCLEILWKDVTSPQVNDEDVYYEMDEIVNKLSLSETLETVDKNSNSTSLQPNSTATENSKDESPFQNSACAPARLIDYMSPQERIVILKSCTRLLGKSKIVKKTINVLVENCIDDLDSDIEMLRQAKANDDTHEIECVDAAILFASIANKDDDKVEGKVAGSQKMFTQSINTSDRQVEESRIVDDVLFESDKVRLEALSMTKVPNVLSLDSIATLVKTRCHGVVWDMIECALPILPISRDLKVMVSMVEMRTILSKPTKVGATFTNTYTIPQISTYVDVSKVNDLQIAKSTLKTSLYDCSVIIQAAIAINHKSQERVMQSCLKIAETSSFETIKKMENGDVVNLISGIASIGSTMPMTVQAANKLSLMIRLALCREYRTFSFTQLSCLLEAIATAISTQRFPIIHDLSNNESVLALIEHGMERMKCSDIATIHDLANLAWAYAECNKLCSRSSWEHFEILGRCVAAVSSGFIKDDVTVEENISPAIDHNILCKIAFAVSLLDLDAYDLNQAILEYSRKDQSLFSPANLLNQIRLLYSIAKSKQNIEHSIPPEYNIDIKRCIGAVMKAKLDILSPYNFALVVWSIGRLCGEEVSSLMTNLPSYTREELGVLSPTMTLRLMNGIVMVFDANDIQTNTRVQLMLKNLLLHLDNQITAMTPKELCGAGRIIVNLRSFCLSDGDEDALENQESSKVDENILDEVDRDVENEAEELVISSLFPISNRKDMLQLCDAIVPRLLNRSRTSITCFTPKEMTIILDTFNAKHRKALFDTIQIEIDRRISLVRSELSKSDDTEIEEDAKSKRKSDNKSYKSQLRQLFSAGSAIERSEEDTTYDGIKSEEVSQVVDLLRDTLNEDALNMVLLRTALDSAYDLGRCKWQTTRSVQNRKCVPDWSTSDLYP